MPRGSARCASVVLLAATITMAPSLAWACSCGVEAPSFQLTKGARLPSDSRGVVFWCGGLHWVIDDGGQSVADNPLPKEDEFAIERLDKRERVAHAIEPIVEPAPWGGTGRVANALLLVARQPLVPGGRYRFRGPDDAETEITVDDAAFDRKPLKLQVAAQKRSSLTIGVGMSCVAEVDAAQRDVALHLDDAMTRFAPSLLFTTSVDGASWRPTSNYCSPTPPGRSWRGDGKELLFAVCGDQQKRDGLTANTTHWVQMRVTVPGSDKPLESARESFVLTCPTPVSPTVEPPAPVQEASGCGACSVGRARAHGWIAALLLVAGAVRRRGR